ncbi:MAG: His-Xaa-Ser system radical SAM maturase HxsB, partial [Anaerovorax sp.]
MPLKSDFNFSEFHPGVYLLTNTAGRFIFLQNEAFHAFCNGKPTKETLLQLKHEFFYSLDNKEVFTANYAHEVRKYRDYLFSGTGLHIFVLTSACNLGCLYCQASTNT